MKPTHAHANGSWLRWIVLVLGFMVTTLAILSVPVSTATADPTDLQESVQRGQATPIAQDEEPEEPEEFTLFLRGNVQFNGEPVEGVLITVSGGGFETETETDADGRWEVGVPEKSTFTVSLDEDTLPDGVIVADGGSTREAEFGLTSSASVNFFLGEGERTTVNLVDQIVQRTMNGLNFGLLLALAAIGLSLIFGTTGLANFAHAEMITFGALMMLTFGVDLAWPAWIAIAITIVLSAILGWSLDAALWRPLRRKSVGIVQLMIVSIGLSLALRYLFQFFYGGQTRQLPNATVPAELRLGPIALSWIDVTSMLVSIVVLLAVAFFLVRTRLGKATRAVSDNPSLAAASGIDVDWVIRLVWILGAALAGLAGILWAYFRPGVTWDMGFQLLLLVFAAVVLGGLGTAFGALVGSIVVGLFVELSTLWLPSDMKYVGALVILIVVLLFRPQGILGRRERIG